MTILHLDFETRSACDLKTAGVFVYAKHPTTEVMCAAYAAGDGPVQLWTPKDSRPPEPIADAVRGGWEIHAHNAQFEHMVWLGVCAAKYGWPKPRLDQLRCTMAAAAAMALPLDLDGAAIAMGLTNRKDVATGRLMLQMSKPRTIVQGPGGPVYTWWEDDARLARLYEYCRQDVRVERELGARLRKLPEDELAVWRLDQKINARGVQIDREALAAAQYVVRVGTDDANARLHALTGGKIASVNHHADFVKWLNANGVDAESVAKAAVGELLAKDDLPPHVRDVLTLRAASAKASVAKLRAFEARLSADGRARGNLQYHGAATGRWSGRGIQLQNLPRSNIENMDLAIGALKTRNVRLIDDLVGEPLEAVSGVIRGLIVAKPGHDLIAGDYSQIEARVLAWLAGQTDLLALFASGGKVYEKMAASIYRVPVEDIGKKDPRRQVGKAATLGCGFGMGATRFISHCATSGVAITQALSEIAIAAYRAENAAIVRYWGTLEKTAMDAVAYPGKWHVADKIAYKTAGGVLWCRLPSGRMLSYVKPSLELAPTPWGESRLALHYWALDTFTKKWSKQNTYGGALAENVTQAVARDVMVNGMLRCEAKGWPIVLTVHDEIVGEVPSGSVTAHELEAAMCDLAAWADGLPVAAEAWVGARYRK